MTTTERTCIDCGRALPPSRTRPALRCGECKRGRRRIKERDPVVCEDCGIQFAPPAHTGKPPVRCTECGRKHRRAANTARVAAWRSANPDRRRAYDREYQARRREDPAYRAKRDELEIIRKYGLTMADFDALLESQGGACAICKGAPSGPGKRFHVDHCHNSSKVRGLLCGRCNTAIGLLGDDPERAESAAAYLRQ